jgi:DNA modification methylase
MKSILESGWTPNSRIICTANQDGTLRLVDGRHRVEAIKLLTAQQRDAIFPNGVAISVYNRFTDEEELAVSIAANATTGTIVKTTFFDKMFSLRKGKDLLLNNQEVVIRDTHGLVVVSRLAQKMVERGLALGMNPTSCRVALSILALCENDICWNYLEEVFEETENEDCIGYSAVSKAPIKDEACFKEHGFFKSFLERLVRYYKTNGKAATERDVKDIVQVMKSCWNELVKVKQFCALKAIDINKREIQKIIAEISEGVYDIEINAASGITTPVGKVLRALKKFETEIANTSNEPSNQTSSIISTPFIYRPDEEEKTTARPISNVTPVEQWDVFTGEGHVEREEVTLDTQISALEMHTPRYGFDTEEEIQASDLASQIMTKNKLVTIINSTSIRKSLFSSLAGNVELVEKEVHKQWKFHHMSCDDMFKKYENELQGKVKIFYCDPPYNVLKSDRDYISDISMAKIVNYGCHWLRPNGVFFIYCSWQQAGTWRRLMTEKGLIVEKSLFTIVYSSKIKRLTNAGGVVQNMAQYAVVAHKPGEHPFTFNWKGIQKYVKGKHSRGCNVVTGYTPPSLKLRDNNNTVLVPEQKSIALSQEILSRFCSPGNIVVDLFGGSGSSLIAAMKSGYRFYGCERDKTIFTFAYIEICNMYRHFQRNGLFESAELDTCGVELDEDKHDVIGFNCEEKYLEMMEAGGEDKWLEVRDEMARQFKVVIRPSKIHGVGVFAAEEIPADTVVGYYWGEVIGDTIYDERLALGRDKMMKTSFNLNDENQTSLYIDGFDWSVGSYFNSSGGNNPKAPNAIYHEDIKGAKAVDNRPGRYYISRADALDERMISIVTLENIRMGDEICVNYGSTFDLEVTNEDNDIEDFYQNSQAFISTLAGTGEIQAEEEAGSRKRKRKAKSSKGKKASQGFQFATPLTQEELELNEGSETEEHEDSETEGEEYKG